MVTSFLKFLYITYRKDEVPEEAGICHRKLSVDCGTIVSSSSTSFFAVALVLVSLLQFTCSLACYFRTIFLRRTAVPLRTLSKGKCFDQKKKYTQASLCRAPPKRLDRMWHNPVLKLYSYEAVKRSYIKNF